MPVYVDDMNARYRRMKMCHMIATSEDELHVMAAKIGVARKWYQGDHYDVCLEMKVKALALGAIAITWRQCGCMVALRKSGQDMGDPQTAVERFRAYRQRPIQLTGG